MTTTTPANSAHSTGSAGVTAVPSGGLSRRQRAIGVLGLVVVFWVGDRLYDVVDRGGTSPGGGRGPGGSPPTSQPTGGEANPGGGTTGHDPSQFDH